MQIRRYIRLPVEFAVEFSGEESFGEGVLTDLSMGGGSVVSDQPVQVGWLLRLRIPLSDTEKPVVVQQAKVKWVGEGQFGLEILVMSKEDQQRLNQFIVGTINKSPRRSRPSTPSFNS